MSSRKSAARQIAERKADQAPPAPPAPAQDDPNRDVCIVLRARDAAPIIQALNTVDVKGFEAASWLLRVGAAVNAALAPPAPQAANVQEIAPRAEG